MRITSLGELHNISSQMNGCIFRGQKDCNWVLETSIERCCRRLGILNKRDYEWHCLREFQRHARSFLDHVPHHLDTLEWLALMQHFGAPTRLLDFTDSFWIAVFFAYEDAENDCAVWAVERGLLGNINSLRRSYPNEGRNFDFNRALRENIRMGDFETESVYFDVPFYTNERLAIQKGTFLFTLNNNQSVSELIKKNDKVLTKIIISRSLYPAIRKHMNDFNCNARVLFPGIDGYARYFKNHTFLL